MNVTFASACIDVVGSLVFGIGGKMHSPFAAFSIVVVVALASFTRAGSAVSESAIRSEKLSRIILASMRADMSNDMVW